MEIFRGKVCVVTGGASGVGYALCSRLAMLGAKLVLADINIEGAQAIVAEKEMANVELVKVDVTDASSVQQLIEQSAEKYGRIDYLFNNAGIAIIGEIRDLSLEQWKRVIEINLFGVLRGVHHVYPIMIKQGFGHIVNTASGFGLAPGPTNTPYVTSKFGIVGMSESLRAEAKDFGIDVTIVCPGYIKTSLITQMQTANVEPEDVMAQIPVELVDVGVAADNILRGVAQKKKVIVFPRYVNVLTFMYRFFPSLFLKSSLKQIRNFRKIRKADKKNGVVV